MSFEECPNCGTGQLQHEQYWGCLCSIICDVELTTEERIIKLLNNDDLVPRLNTPQGNWVHLDTLLALIKGENNVHDS